MYSSYIKEFFHFPGKILIINVFRRGSFEIYIISLEIPINYQQTFQNCIILLFIN